MRAANSYDIEVMTGEKKYDMKSMKEWKLMIMDDFYTYAMKYLKRNWRDLK
jgi:hypothetical protein